MFRVMQRNPNGDELCLVNGLGREQAQSWANGYVNGLCVSDRYTLVNETEHARWLQGPAIWVMADGKPLGRFNTYCVWWEAEPTR